IPDGGADCNLVLSAGTATVGGAKTFSSAVTINPITNQLVLGVTNTVTISSTAPAASRTLTIADPLAAANIMLSTRGTVTQITTASTGVTLNSQTGVITTVSLTN